MNSIIVVLPKPEDGKSIRNLLSRHGYDVTAVCTQGSQVLNYIDMMNDGIIISGYKFSDMYYLDLKNSLPEGFDMLLLASQRVCSECGDRDIVCVSMPLKAPCEGLLHRGDILHIGAAARRKHIETVAGQEFILGIGCSAARNRDQQTALDGIFLQTVDKGHTILFR